jgi:hypothetical protein
MKGRGMILNTGDIFAYINNSYKYEQILGIIIGEILEKTSCGWEKTYTICWLKNGLCSDHEHCARFWDYVIKL